MAYTLILDTSSKQLAVGIASQEKVLVKKQYYAWQRQSEFTIPEINALLNELGISMNDITKVVVAFGPGSYTGIRIALTVAKTLALVKKIELVAISSLQALAGEEENVVSVIDARSQRLYTGFYHHGIALQDDTILTNEEVIKLKDQYKVIGELSALGEEDSVIDIIENMFRLSLKMQAVADIHAVKPQYLKDLI